MNNMHALLEMKLRKQLGQHSLQTLLEIFENIEDAGSEPEANLLRNLLLAELRRRDPSAFRSWSECISPELSQKPSHFFKFS